MFPVFPEVSVEVSEPLEPRQTRNPWIANPKAVAAQTFRSKSVDPSYLDSGIWALLHPFFDVQVAGFGPVPSPPVLSSGQIAFPWTVASKLKDGVTLIWIDSDGWVRHVRAFSTQQAASAANQKLAAVFTASRL